MPGSSSRLHRRRPTYNPVAVLRPRVPSLYSHWASLVLVSRGCPQQILAHTFRSTNLGSWSRHGASPGILHPPPRHCEGSATLPRRPGLGDYCPPLSVSASLQTVDSLRDLPLQTLPRLL